MKKPQGPTHHTAFYRATPLQDEFNEVDNDSLAYRDKKDRQMSTVLLAYSSDALRCVI